MADSHLTRQLFGSILGRIDQLTGEPLSQAGQAKRRRIAEDMFEKIERRRTTCHNSGQATAITTRDPGGKEIFDPSPGAQV
jgi:hypothetical protein